MVKEIPKNNEIGLLIEVIKCKIDIADLRINCNAESKDLQSYHVGQKEAYKDILKLLRSLLPEVEIS